MNNHLFKVYVNRDGKRYIDLYVAWRYKEKVFSVRVQPCFKSNDTKLLLSHAQLIESIENVEKYM